MLRIAIAGCGWAARTLHAPAIRLLPGGKIVAVSDPSAGAMAAFPDARHFAGHGAMLDETLCDAVLVAAPPALHADVAVAALDHGLPVLLEKPLAVTPEDGERIAAAARSSGRIVAVGFNLRCHPALRRLRTRIGEGAFGDLQSVHVQWNTTAGLGAREWIGVRAQGGGALFDLGSHVVDLWRFLTGAEIEALQAVSRSVEIDDEQATLTATMTGGAKMSAQLSLVDAGRFAIEVVGSRGRATLRPYGRVFATSYLEQWRAFGSAVQGDGAVAAGLADGLASLAWIHRAARGLPASKQETPPPIEFALSAIAATTRGFEAIRTTVAHLRRQTAAKRMELVLVGPSIESLWAPAEELAGFAAVVRVAAGPATTIAQANAAGVRRSRGRVVVLTEDHCFPEPDWAAALLEAHEGDCSVVGPVVRNANPATMVSEADFAIGYSTWMEPMPAQPMAFLPSHNSSYKRDDLLSLGARLERILEAETVLHMQWSSAGRKLLLEPRMRVRHVNVSRWRSWIILLFLSGRIFGAARSAAWSWRRRLFYAAASPLIPAVRFCRIARAFTRPEQSLWRLFRMSPALAAGLLVDGAGQCLGYLRGPGDAMRRLAFYEFNRIEHVRRAERELWTSA